MVELLIKLFIAAVFVVIAVLLWRGWQDRRASTQWPTVEGVVLVSDVVRYAPDPHDDLRHVGWLLKVEYDYSVGGQHYRGKRVRALPERFSMESDARQALTAYPVGAKVRVHHDPAKPGSSVLQPG